MSAYFTYFNPQNYIRTLTQGVTLSGTGKHITDYKKLAIQSIGSFDLLNGSLEFVRRCIFNVTNKIKTERTPIFMRRQNEQVGINSLVKEKREINRKCVNVTFCNDDAKRSQGFLRITLNNVKVVDTNSYSVLFLRTLNETQNIIDDFWQWRCYFRFLYNDAVCDDETARCSNYYRSKIDGVQVKGDVYRGIMIFIKLLTTSIVRDFFIRRFLVAREQLNLKSKITFNLSLESKIS